MGENHPGLLVDFLSNLLVVSGTTSLNFWIHLWADCVGIMYVFKGPFLHTVVYLKCFCLSSFYIAPLFVKPLEDLYFNLFISECHAIPKKAVWLSPIFPHSMMSFWLVKLVSLLHSAVNLHFHGSISYNENSEPVWHLANILYLFLLGKGFIYLIVFWVVLSNGFRGWYFLLLTSFSYCNSTCILTSSSSS